MHRRPPSLGFLPPGHPSDRVSADFCTSFPGIPEAISCHTNASSVSAAICIWKENALFGRPVKIHGFCCCRCLPGCCCLSSCICCSCSRTHRCWSVGRFGDRKRKSRRYRCWLWDFAEPQRERFLRAKRVLEGPIVVVVVVAIAVVSLLWQSVSIAVAAAAAADAVAAVAGVVGGSIN